MKHELNVLGVKKRFGGVVAVDGFSREFSTGQAIGIIGPNGSGKSTLVNCISGQLKPDTGSIYLDQTELTGLPPHAISRLGLARTFQEPQVFPGLSIRDNLRAVWPGSGSSVVSRRVFDLLAETGITGNGDLGKLAGSLSYGQQKLLGLFIALLQMPKFLILDEPVAGVSEVNRGHIQHALKAALNSGTGIILVEHDFGFVAETCEEVLVIDAGRMVASGKPHDFRENPEVVAAYLGDEARLQLLS